MSRPGSPTGGSSGARKKAGELFIWHDYAQSRSKIAPGLASPEERAALPPACWRMVWKNPVNGRSALYLASHAYAIEGMEQAAAQQLIAELMGLPPRQVSYMHQWQAGDVVMWDNRATMHRGRPWPALEARLMVRTTIRPAKPTASPASARPRSKRRNNKAKRTFPPAGKTGYDGYKFN